MSFTVSSNLRILKIMKLTNLAIAPSMKHSPKSPSLGVMATLAPPPEELWDPWAGQWLSLYRPKGLCRKGLRQCRREAHGQGTLGWHQELGFGAFPPVPEERGSLCLDCLYKQECVLGTCPSSRNLGLWNLPGRGCPCDALPRRALHTGCHSSQLGVSAHPA